MQFKTSKTFRKKRYSAYAEQKALILLISSDEGGRTQGLQCTSHIRHICLDKLESVYLHISFKELPTQVAKCTLI